MSYINTSLHQPEKPKIITGDSRGTGFYEGARVAYNRSGDVKIGYLQKIVKNEWKIQRPGISGHSWWGLKFEAHVEGEDGNISKIKNPNGLIII